jgi:glycosyltransferase involved in cell wall biosynthesis
MDSNTPFISVIIPCLNEEELISKCIDSILANDYAYDNLEILIIDGMSKDKTRKLVKEYMNKHYFIRLLDNPKKKVPNALNIGIKNARGDIIIRMDAHTQYEKEYISKCIIYLQKNNVDNVGGICITVASNNTLIAQAIVLVLSHPFGVGNSYFRIGTKEPKYVDAVPFGCYKREVFNKIGLFNENLIRNQDIEFNLRLKRAGGKILLVPDIISYYHARSTLISFANNNFLNGFWVIYGIKFSKLPFSIRHLVPLFFILSLISTSLLSIFYHPFLYVFASILGLYSVINIFFSLKLSLIHGIRYFSTIVSAFSTLHFSYGFGSLWGSIKLLTSSKS